MIIQKPERQLKDYSIFFEEHKNRSWFKKELGCFNKIHLSTSTENKGEQIYINPNTLYLYGSSCALLNDSDILWQTHKGHKGKV